MLKISAISDRNETKAFFSIALILLLSFSTLLVTLPAANASDPPIEIPTFAYLAITPNPTGINQQVFFVMWLHAAPPTAAGIAGDRWRDFTVTVTRPDGETETLGPYLSDATGSTYGLYTPTQIGTYKFVFEYPGQVLSLNHPENGLPGSNSPYINDTFLASSATEYLTVQEEQVTSSPEYPLPASYWVRPIEAQNQMWSQVASNWLGSNYFGTFQQTGLNLWQRNGAGPESSHILWTRPIEFGGLVGGSFAVPNAGFYSGGSYEGRFTNAIIMSGRLYYQEPLGHSNTGGGYTCVDLRTGETMWHRDDVGVIGGSAAPTFGQLYDYESMNQHGVVGGILWAPNFAIGYDAFTGKVAFNLTGVPSGTEVYTDSGEILRYVLNYNTTLKSGTLRLWNNTQEQMGLHGALGTGSSAYQWRPNGKSINMSTAFSWEVPITADLVGNANPAIVYVLPGDVILGRSSAVSPGVGDKFTPDPYTMWAISDNPENRGQLLWKQSYSAPEGNVTRRLGPLDPITRVWTMFDVETMQWLGYSVDTGHELWGPTDIDVTAYQYYGSGEGGGQRAVTAYGNLYVQGFGGELLCISLTDGHLVWKFNDTNSGIDTPWGLRPIFISAVADGKVYAFNNEHSPNVPLYKGQKIYCIDANSGEEIWSMLGWAGQSGGRGTSTSVLADGVLVYYNYYNSQLYAVGKGPSKTTVEAPLTSVAQGTGVVIRGTVEDISAGAKAKVASGEFNIVPAVSDASQSSWMEYIYMQKPMPTDATGVPVKIFATGPDGNTDEIATVTSGADGMFYYAWAPSQTGTYVINAVFEGSNSYWPSSSSTVVLVGSASAVPTNVPTETSPPVSPPGDISSTETLLIAAAAAVIIIAVIAVALVLKRRK